MYVKGKGREYGSGVPTCIIICNVHVFLYFANMKIFVDECRGNHVSLNIFVLEDICD